MKATYQIDAAHSSAHFVIRHLMITNVRGSFSGLKGTVIYDSDDLSGSSVEAEIPTATINTQDPNRDAHLKSPEFLNAEKFPTITFKSTKVETAGDGEAKVTGRLTILGVTKEVVLKVEGPTAEGKDPWGNTRIGASATAKIKRSDFGLSWNAALETGGVVLGDELKLEIEVSLIKSA
jgi:polyisoprenoid-binding protein YceI